MGRRFEKAVTENNTTTTTRYLYNGFNIIAEYDENNNVKAQYIHNLGIDDQLAMIKNGNTYYYHKDGLDSITAITDSSANVVQTYAYDSFGNIVNQTGTINQPYTFTGREYDKETGMYFYNARYYDQKTGTFISKDPIGFAGGDVNLYKYVGNNPINFVDPMGLYKKGSVYCLRLLKKIENIQNRIDTRIGQLHENPLNLPEITLGDDKHPSLSQSGHRKLINVDKVRLAALKGLYLATCSDDPPNGSVCDKESFFDKKYWEQATGLTGSALIVYLIVSEGSRLYPPRNIVPVP